MSINNSEFQPQDITIRDDAWHRKTNFFHIETWYFDGNFYNNYSVVALVNILTLGYYRLVQTGYFIYNDTNLVISKRERHPYKNINGSDKKPFLKINNNYLISADEDESSKEWIYKISMGNREAGFDLNLKKTMKPNKLNDIIRPICLMEKQ